MSKRLFRLVAASGAALLFAGVIVVAQAVPAAAADITTACTGDLVGDTFTLTANCSTTEPLTVPDGVTIDGQNLFTISVSDLNVGAPQWNGAIVTNAPGATSMNIQNVTIQGPPGGFQLCVNSGNVLYGIFFNDASGSVDNVTVDHIFQIQNGAFGSCQTGRAIRAEGITAERLVTITNTTVKDYQKSGFEPRGSMTMNLSDSTAGPSHPLEGLISQNGVSYVGAQGTVENNTIFGSGDAQDGVGGNGAGTAVLLSGAHDVTVTNNTLTSPAAPRPGTDIGVSVSAASATGIVISFNQVNRLGPDVPDTFGIGIDVDPADSSATLICNTFETWRTNISGAIQIDCTPLPDGMECVTYSAHTPNVQGGTEPFTWEITAGSLPPGLTMASDGAITGTPTQVGTFPFTVQVTDTSETALTATQDLSITIAPDCTTPTTPTTPGPGVGAGAATRTEPLARTGGSSTTLVTMGLISLITGVGLVLIAGRRRSRLRSEA